jgi:two-component system, cell cycle sensor histidine kinase and response regulator CckA
MANAANPTGAPQRVELDLITDDGRRWPAVVLVATHGERITLGVLERLDEAAGGKTPRAAEQRLSRFFQSAPFGIASIDADGVLLNTNTTFSRLLLDGAAQRGTNLLDTLGRIDAGTRREFESALDAARDGKANIQPFDIMLGVRGQQLARKVTIMSLARSGSAPPPPGQDAAIVYIHDVTDAKALEHKVAQAQKMQAVGTLAGGIAHDFNNVLTAIIGFSDLLLQTHKPGNQSYAHILSVKSSANRAAGLVRQLLAFSRRQTLQPKVLQLGDVLTDWSMLLNRLLGEKIELKISTGRDLWFVKADPSELERTIINLAVNARDAMLPKGGRLNIRTRNISERDSQKLEAAGLARGEYVMIEVEDTGTGMTPEILAKIFDPFFTTKAVGKGTGLGLASVTGFVQQTGGYILPESTLGQGTTFRIYLPRYHLEAEEEVEVVTPVKKLRSGDLTGTGRVLLVEDEDAVRRFAVAALKSKGYEVLEAGNGLEALDVMEACNHQVDLVVSDVIMPEMDGTALLKELRKTSPKLKFIFVSGYPDDAFKNNLDPDAEFTFLPKPYSLAQLAAKVKEQITG